MMDDRQMSLADEARARATDPGTSHAAARSVENLRERQRAVLNVLVRYGPASDETIAERYAILYPEIPQSPSGLRTRRRELVDADYLEDSGVRELTASGRQTIVWRVRP